MYLDTDLRFSGFSHSIAECTKWDSTPFICFDMESNVLIEAPLLVYVTLNWISLLVNGGMQCDGAGYIDQSYMCINDTINFESRNVVTIVCNLMRCHKISFKAFLWKKLSRSNFRKQKTLFSKKKLRYRFMNNSLSRNISRGSKQKKNQPAQNFRWHSRTLH